MYKFDPGEAPMYGDFPDLRKCVGWFKTLMTEAEWHARRDAVAKRFYKSLVGEVVDPKGVGRFFDDRDMFGWYLFLGEAFTDHPWNYEVIFGSRVVPVLAAIGRNLDLLLKVDGFIEKAAQLVANSRSQPNGPIFEMLVAAAYARAGGTVKFNRELPGQEKTNDLNVLLGKTNWAVECKRMEVGEYVEKERARMRLLWHPAALRLASNRRSALLNVDFKIEMSDVPDDYLSIRADQFLGTRRASFSWGDDVSTGIFTCLDLRPLQDALTTSYWLFPGPQYEEILTGTYRRYKSTLVLQMLKPAANPHFVDEVSFAAVARWGCSAEPAIDSRARDILSKLAEADSQLPANTPGVIHIGFECLGDDAVEQKRYEKIIRTARKFISKKQLHYLYCHYFAPEASPTETWAFDETVQWLGIEPSGRPLERGMLVLPDSEGGRAGVHWIPPA
jgi:hypothetical protein